MRKLNHVIFYISYSKMSHDALLCRKRTVDKVQAVYPIKSDEKIQPKWYTVIPGEVTRRINQLKYISSMYYQKCPKFEIKNSAVAPNLHYSADYMNELESGIKNIIIICE